MASLFRLPVVDCLEGARNVLLAGAGGGFDIFAGLPLYQALRALGKSVHLANLSFSRLDMCTGGPVGEGVVRVDASTEGPASYFPEGHLARWLAGRLGEDVPIYCIPRTGVAPTVRAYHALVDRLAPDALVLVDGGSDSLMCGDEAGLGTPQEDVASLAAADSVDLPTRLLVCIGFGIDAFHGVCHAHVLRAMADLAASGGYLGAWSLTREMPEAAFYAEALAAVHGVMPDRPSIVNTSIVAAVEGRFGDYHATERTQGSRLFINPLMALYWAFDLGAVARRNLYLDRVRATETYGELTAAIEMFRVFQTSLPWTELPI